MDPVAMLAIMSQKGSKDDAAEGRQLAARRRHWRRGVEYGQNQWSQKVGKQKLIALKPEASDGNATAMAALAAP